MTTAKGERVVAVKVVRPGIREQFARDLQAMRFAARLLERIAPEARRLRALEVVGTLARSVAIEMDMRLEAAALSEPPTTPATIRNFASPARNGS